MISGPDAIILLKAIMENQGKEPEPMLLPREEKAPISIPRWGPDSTNPRPYDPIKFGCECETSDNKNCLTTTITRDGVEPYYSGSTTEGISVSPRKLSI